MTICLQQHLSLKDILQSSFLRPKLTECINDQAH